MAIFDQFSVSIIIHVHVTMNSYTFWQPTPHTLPSHWVWEHTPYPTPPTHYPTPPTHTHRVWEHTPYLTHTHTHTTHAHTQSVGAHALARSSGVKRKSTNTSYEEDSDSDEDSQQLRDNIIRANWSQVTIMWYAFLEPVLNKKGGGSAERLSSLYATATCSFAAVFSL